MKYFNEEIYPNEVAIEITNKCNMDCIMCPRKRMRRNIGNIELSLFEKMLKEISQFPNKPILKFNFNGDFLTLPNTEIIKYLEIVRRYCPHNICVLTTNGLGLSSEKIQSFKKYQINHFHISIDAFTSETYLKIRQNGHFNKVKDNIEKLIRLKDDNMKIQVSLVKQKDNESEVDEFVKYWSPKVDSVYIGSVCSRGGAISLVKEETKNDPCFMLWDRIVICNDGLVALCCQDWDCQNIIGDTNNDSLKDIWNGNIIRSIRKSHIKGEMPLICGNCNPQLWNGDSFPDEWKKYFSEINISERIVLAETLFC